MCDKIVAKMRVSVIDANPIGAFLHRVGEIAEQALDSSPVEIQTELFRAFETLSTDVRRESE